MHSPLPCWYVHTHETLGESDWKPTAACPGPAKTPQPNFRFSDWQRKKAARSQWLQAVSRAQWISIPEDPLAKAPAELHRRSSYARPPRSANAEAREAQRGRRKKNGKFGDGPAARSHDILKTSRGDKRHARALTLQQCVGTDRGTVKQNQSVTAADLFQCLYNRSRRVVSS